MTHRELSKEQKERLETILFTSLQDEFDVLDRFEVLERAEEMMQSASPHKIFCGRCAKFILWKIASAKQIADQLLQGDSWLTSILDKFDAPK